MCDDAAYSGDDAIDLIQPFPQDPIAPQPTLEQVCVRVVVISKRPDEVMATIYELYQRGFAPVTHWSRLQPVPNSPGEVMSVMTRRRGRPIARSTT